MKRKIILFSALGTLITGMTVCAATGVASFKKQTVAFSSTRAVVAPTDVEDYDAWLNSWSKPNHLYVHYNRGDKNDYDQFCYWMWNDEDDTNGTLWAYGGQTTFEGKNVQYHPMTKHWMWESDIQSGEANTVYKDAYGVIADVDLGAANLHEGKTKKGVDPGPATYEGCEDFGFLFPKTSSMDGSAHWTSDGGKDNDVWDWRETQNWRDVEGGKAIHIFFSSGQLDEYSYFAGSGIPQVKVNPIDTATDNTYDSRTESIPDTYGVSPTSKSFKKLGVGYQVFVASFRDSNGDGYGDLRGVIDSLDYLKDLGVEVLWLTPIQQSGSYHGYDIIDYYAVDKRFGTVDDYRELLYKAHQKGMKVLMDLVINHTSKNNAWFKKSEWGYNSYEGSPTDNTGIRWRDIYTWKFGSDTIPTAVKANGPLFDNNGDPIKENGVQVEGEYVVKPISYTTQTVAENALSPNGASWYKNGESNYYYYGKFGADMPELNYENRQTRKLVQDMAKYWLSFGLDGFRLDAVKHIYMKDEVSNTGSDQIMPDVGITKAYDEQNERYIYKPYDYSQDLTKNIAFWKQFANEIKKVYPDCFLVGENFDGYGTRMAGYYQALDSQFDFAGYYHSADMYSKAGGAANYTDKRSTEVLNTFVNDSNQIDDPYSTANPAPKISVPGGRRPDFINGAYTSNHDVMRAINKISESNTVTGSDAEIGRAKIAAATAILAPGISWIYYGDELGMSSNIETHIDKYGNENCLDTWYRQPFMWQAKSTLGADVKKEIEKVRPSFVNGKYQFNSENYDSYNSTLFTANKGVILDENKNFTVNNEIYDFYKELIELKKMYPDAAVASYQNGNQIMIINVWSDEAPGDAFKIYINLGINNEDYILNPGSDFNPTPVKQINCSGLTVSSHFTTKYSVVAFRHV